MDVLENIDIEKFYDILKSIRLCDDRAQLFLEANSALNKLFKRSEGMGYSVHGENGIHYDSCVWSRDDCLNGPDTCPCCYVALAAYEFKQKLRQLGLERDIIKGEEEL